MKKIITVLGDSLSMARSEYGIFYKDTYSYILMEILGESSLVLNKAKRTNTIANQTHFQYIYDDVLTTNSKFFIIQLGIVDCAPRVISIMEGKILKYLRPKILSKVYIKIKSKYRFFFTKHFPKVYVDKKKFKKRYEFLISTIIEKTEAEKIILINIADTNKKNKQGSYGFDENIKKYNTIIQNIKNKFNNKTELIDLYAETKNNPNLILDDGIHITKTAHKILAENIAKKIPNHKILIK